MYSCRGGSTCVVVLPDCRAVHAYHCKKNYTHVVTTNHVNTVGWGWFRMCTSLEEAEKCVKEDIPKSEAAWGFIDIKIIECRMLQPWVDYCRIDD
jgi:hypothetical protein